MSEESVKSTLWDSAPVLQDAPLTIFAGLRGLDVLLAVGAFFASYLLLQWLTTIRLMILLLTAIGIGIAFYAAILAVRKMGPDGFHWSFLHWFGVLPIRGAMTSRGIINEPF